MLSQQELKTWQKRLHLLNQELRNTICRHQNAAPLKHCLLSCLDAVHVAVRRDAQWEERFRALLLLEQVYPQHNEPSTGGKTFWPSEQQITKRHKGAAPDYSFGSFRTKIHTFETNWPSKKQLFMQHAPLIALLNSLSKLWPADVLNIWGENRIHPNLAKYAKCIKMTCMTYHMASGKKTNKISGNIIWR